MPIVEISGFSIDYPFEPYQCQIKYMEKVLQCLEKGSNGILESPTGTGKTLCLLCACLAWLKQKKTKLNLESAAAAAAASQQSQSSQFSSQNSIFQSFKRQKTSKNAKSTQETGIFQAPCAPKIIYTSRTHSQLSQVIKELNKTSHKSWITVSYFGSRDKLCINDQVQKEENSTIKNNLCRAKIQTRQCPFFWSIDTVLIPQKNEVVDIEDFVELGRKHRFCPYFKYREKSDIADLVLMPYNYILDPRVRKANKIDLKDSILIIDEAHNLEKVCEESSSVSFSTKDLAGCQREAKQALATILAEEEQLRKAMDETELGFGKAEAENKMNTNLDTKELAHFIVLLESLEKEVDKIDYDILTSENTSNSRTLDGKVLNGGFLYDLLQKSGLNATLAEPILNLTDQLSSYLAQQSGSSLWQTKGVYLHKFATFVNTIFQKGDPRLFKVFVQKEQNPNVQRRLDRKNYGLLFNYWCFSATLSMENLKNEGVKSLIITSGTLSPINRFIDQLGLNFDAILENEHVIQESQISFNVLNRGPDSNVLSARFDNRNDEKYLNSLWSTLINLMRLTPGGLLVFFGSYSHMQKCIEFWQQNDKFEKMTQAKPVCLEAKFKQEFEENLKKFSQFLQKDPKRGASFFGVCRGKLSEGFDFSDNAARCVVLVGIPYPPMMDPKVILKQCYLNEKKDNVKFNGQVWYNTEAVRAVNQAIGRVIRHKNDFGAIVLADERFSNWDPSNFPRWIREIKFKNLQQRGSTFGPVLKELNQFFRQKSGLQNNLRSIFAENDNEKTEVLDKKVQEDYQRRILNREDTCFRKKEPSVPNPCVDLDINFDDEYDQKTNLGENSPSTSSKASSLFDVLEDTKSTVPAKRKLPSPKKEASSSKSNSNFVNKKQLKMTIVRTFTQKYPDRKQENVECAADFILDVKAALPEEKYRQFAKFGETFKENRRYDEFLSNVKDLLSVDYPALFEGFLKFDFTNSRPRQ